MPDPCQGMPQSRPIQVAMVWQVRRDSQEPTTRSWVFESTPMSQAPDLETLLPPTVDAVLGMVGAVSGLIPAPDRDTFTVSVLLNALSHSLEEIRERDPREYLLYQEIALSMLSSGPEVPPSRRPRRA